MFQTGKEFDEGSQADEEASLAGGHAQLLEVHADEGEKGPEGGVEEEVKRLGE